MAHTDNIILYVVIILLFIIIVTKNMDSENFQRFGGPPLAYACEFREECLEDNTRSIALNDRIEGVCTMHGLACPSFLLDQNLTTGIPFTPKEYNDFHYK